MKSPTKCHACSTSFSSPEEFEDHADECPGRSPVFDYKIRVLTIYNNPSDYPGEFVARWATGIDGQVVPDPEPFARGKTLEEIREKIPAGLVCMPRSEDDEPQIVESWL